MPRVAFIIGDYPPEERRRREQVALSYSSAEVEVGIVSVPATPYVLGLTPAEIQLVAPAFIEAFRTAENKATTRSCHSELSISESTGGGP